MKATTKERPPVPENTTPKKADPRKDEPIITPEADRVLGRINLMTFGAVIVLLPATTLGMGIWNAHLNKHEQFIPDALSILIVMLPFYFGMNKLYKERLRFGREYAADKRWKETIAALLPFDSLMQRFLDPTGEAHYLLAQAYASTGDKKKSERLKNFVLKNRPGVWAEKLTVAPRPKASEILAPKDKRGERRSAAEGVEAQTTAAAPNRQGQEKPGAPAKSRRRRRF